MTLFSKIDKLLGNNQIKTAIDEFQKFIANCPAGNDDLQEDLDKVSTSLIILSSKFSDLSEKLNSNTIAPDVADREKAMIINSLVQIKSQMRFNHPELFKYILEKDEESAWQDALHNNTIDGYQDYFSKYPNGKYKEDSIRFIKQLREKREAQDNEIRKIAEQEKVRRENIETNQDVAALKETSLHSSELKARPTRVSSKKTLFLSLGALVAIAVILFLIFNKSSSPEKQTDLNAGVNTTTAQQSVEPASATSENSSTTNTNSIPTTTEGSLPKKDESKKPSDIQTIKTGISESKKPTDKQTKTEEVIEEKKAEEPVAKKVEADAKISVEPVTINKSFSISKVIWAECKTSDGTKTGSFKMTGDKKWTLTSSDGSFEFQESGRDQWSIYLTSPSSGYNVSLDFWRKGVFSGDKQFYVITKVEMDVKTSVEPVAIKESFSIYKVTWAQYKTSDGSKTGTFKMGGDKKWAETNPDGSFQWQESSRDQWSIYLTDPARGMDVRLDFWLKGVFLKDAKLYVITNYAY